MYISWSWDRNSHNILIILTLWLFNIAMEHGPFIDDFPIKTSIYKGFSMAMLVITRGYPNPNESHLSFPSYEVNIWPELQGFLGKLAILEGQSTILERPKTVKYNKFSFLISLT